MKSHDKKSQPADGPLLRVEELVTRFPSAEGHKIVVNEVTFDIEPGQIVSLVGESGSGKSLTALSILQLVDSPGEIAGGQVLFGGRDLLKARGSELQRVRGAEIAMIFQEPMHAMNPVFTVGRQIIETLRQHENLSRPKAYERAEWWLDRVGLPRPERVMRSYPHELSGGMQQRVMIAMALCCNPKLLIADEPTTALDVTVQAQVLDLLADLRDELGMAILFITHDLGVVAQIADSVLVMYGGRVLERGDVFSVFDDPQHPYTKALLGTKPVLGQRLERLTVISDEVRTMASRPLAEQGLGDEGIVAGRAGEETR